MNTVTSKPSRRALRQAAIIIMFVPLCTAGQTQPPEQEMERVIINASPFAAQEDGEFRRPVGVLRGDALRQRQSTNLGSTLQRELGVQSSAFGAGAGRPIIRGMDSARVGVAESGMGAADVSGISPDHRVAADTFNAGQVEILRGPATLLYGSGAIGGLVNVVSERIPLRIPMASHGELNLRAGDADQERTGAVNLNAPLGESAAVRIEAFRQETGDYRLARPLHDAAGELIAERRLPNSATDTRSVAAGATWFAAGWSFGAAVQRYDSDYGVPNPDEPVVIRLKRTRIETRLEAADPLPGITELRFKFAQSDYGHVEYNASGEPGAVFDRRGTEARLELPHAPWRGWKGVVGMQWQQGTLEGRGEGTLPRTDADSIGAFVVEETTAGSLRHDLGARWGRDRYRVIDGAFPSRSFTLASLSAGATWRMTGSLELGVTLTASQRAPAPEELYFEGAHPATAAYETGNAELRKEQSRNVEVALRKTAGPLRFKIAAFNNRFRDYIHGTFDGSTTNVVDEDTGAIEASLANLHYRQADARFRGWEAELSLGEKSGTSGRVWADRVNATLTSGTDAGNYLPRVAPARFGAELAYRKGSCGLNISATRVQRQSHTAAFDRRDGVPETATPGYTMLDAGFDYRFQRDGKVWTWYVQGKNLGDREALVHTSYLKAFAPQPGRALWAGLRAVF